MLVEKPDERQWRDLTEAYGTPRIVDRDWIMQERSDIEAPTCSGEVIVIIFNLAGSCVFVRRPGTSDWFFPMGRIMPTEGIIDAAFREAMEAVGVGIIPVGVPLCLRVTFAFSNVTLQRWHIVVVAETATSVFDHCDHADIVEVWLFDIPPPVPDMAMSSWIHELHRAGTTYMRSLDAMDGI